MAFSSSSSCATKAVQQLDGVSGKVHLNHVINLSTNQEVPQSVSNKHGVCALPCPSSYRIVNASGTNVRADEDLCLAILKLRQHLVAIVTSDAFVQASHCKRWIWGGGRHVWGHNTKQQQSTQQAPRCLHPPRCFKKSTASTACGTEDVNTSVRVGTVTV